MKIGRSGIGLVAILLTSAVTTLIPVSSVTFADDPVRIEEVTVTHRWPKEVVFGIRAASSAADISEVTVRIQTAGKSSTLLGQAKVMPSKAVQAEYALASRDKNFLPVGSVLEYSVEVVDAQGNRAVSPLSRWTYLDPRFEWKAVRSNTLPVHAWYYGDMAATARRLLTTVEQTTAKMQGVGLRSIDPFWLVLYRTREEMQDAQLFVSETWNRERPVDGRAFWEHAVVHVLAGSDQRWAADIAAHEATHMLVASNGGKLVPDWLNEGLAVYAQPRTEGYDAVVAAAVKQNRLVTVRGLSNLPGIPDENLLGYAQALSVVQFLISGYGPDRMAEFLAAMKGSVPVDQALTRVYGFDQDGLDALWRKRVGAPPRSYEVSMPTPIPIPQVGGIDAVPAAGRGETAARAAGTSGPDLPVIAGGCPAMLAMTGGVVLAVRSKRKRATAVHKAG